jgi:AraC-like DNA-binding protein
MSTQLIRSASLSDYVPLAQHYGLDPYALIREAGLDRACLANPDLKIPIKALDRSLELAAAKAGIDDFGLRLAEKRTLSNLGAVGLALREEPDLRTFLSSAVRYIHLHNEAISVQLSTSEPTVTVSLQFYVEGATLGRQSIELAVGVLFRSLQAIIGRDWSPWSVCFSHAAPASFEVHQRLFGSRVLFRQELDGVVIRSADLDRPAPTADPVMARYARQYLETLIGDGSDAQLPGKVRQLATLLLPAGRCSIEHVAKYLGVDRRTVHRQLLHAGTTFTEIVCAVRKDLVVRYLAHGSRTLSETSDLLGFSGQSAFSRWFRQQFDCTAQAWRERQRESAGV